jgi:hypothetical protein
MWTGIKNPRMVGGLGSDAAVADANERHLSGRLASVRLRVRRLLALRGGADPVDPLGSLVITADEVERLLGEGADGAVDGQADAEALADRCDAEAVAAEEQGADLRLLDLARRFGLSRLDVDLLCVALAPELDGRFGRLCRMTSVLGGPASRWPSS